MKKETSQFKDKNILRFLIIPFSFLILFFNLELNSVLADQEQLESFDFVYLFHLYYDNGQLFADRDFDFKYDVIPEKFIPETYTTQFPFKGEIINFLNQKAATFWFDPRRGDPYFLKGKISVKAPYVPDGQKVVFYDAQNRDILTIFVGDSSFCNDDGVCDLNKGEDQKTCPVDCKVFTSLPPVPEEPTGEQSSLLMTIIYALIIIGVGVGGWFGWKWWKSRQKPPTQFPQIPQNPNVQ
jgi:hypothetical protein